MQRLMSWSGGSGGRQMITKLVNTTTRHVVLMEGNSFVKRAELVNIGPKEDFQLHHEPYETYRERYYVKSTTPGKLMELHMEGADEIEIYELNDNSGLGLRISKRSKQSGYYKEDFADFIALKEDASSRMRLIDASKTRLGKLKNRVKICPAQCKNLVQTCLEGLKHMKETYDTVIAHDDQDLWDLYSSKKLRYLIRSVDKLLFILETIEDLLWTCGRRWSRMGLYVSTIPFALSKEKTITKFDILLKELSWNLDIIHYILALSESAKLEWNEDKCRYVLQSDSGASDHVATTEIEPIGTYSLYCEDRAHFLTQIRNESAPSKENFVLLWAILLVLISGFGFLFHSEDRSILSSKSFIWARYVVPLMVVADLFRRIYSMHFGNRHYFATEVLKGRLQDSSQFNDDGAVPDCFLLNPLHLDIDEELSAGSLKAVYHGKWRGEDVAISVGKIREHGRMRESLIQDRQKEAALMLKVQHPNVVEFFGYAFADKAPPPISSGKKPVSASYLVMELMQRDLQREIGRITRKKPGRPFPDDVTVDILLQIVEAMSHMHDCGVIYRDLKAKNCLVNPSLPSKSNSDVCKFYTVKLADFDISKMLDPDASISDHTLRQGTTRWMAPEVWGIGVYVQGEAGQKSTYDNSVDVYSFGMTCYEVISGEVPFYECRINSELDWALQNEERPVLPPGVTCPRRLVDLMSRCWSQNPSDRPDFSEIRKVLWTVKYEVEFQ